MRVRQGIAFVGVLALWLVATAQVAPSQPWAATYSRHAVAADHPLASQAGLEILEEGGNAADAAAATMLALGVASPASSGLGGGGFALYYRASDRSLTFLDFRETAPAASTPTMFARQEGDDDATAAGRSRVGGLAVAVPGEPAGIEALIERFGSGRVTRARITTPAERLARDGFTVSQPVSDVSAWVASTMRGDPLLAGWLGDRERLEPGETLRNPALATTLRSFGRQGARAIYEGRIAQEIVRAVAQRGGHLTREDLASYRVREREPLRADAFGRTWVSSPPPSAGGFTLFHSLAMLEAWQPEGGWHDGPAFRHALTQSWIGAYADRAAVLGDPDHAEVPVDRLLAPERLARRAALFDRWRARPMSEWEIDGSGGEPPRDHGTSHLCVVDAEGNVAAVTTTVNLGFGARISAAGMMLNDEMDDFGREVGAPNAFGLPGGAANLPAPGRRPVSSMSPTIVFQDGLPALCIGGSGGSRIPTATIQVALFALLFDEPIGDALQRPRVHQQGSPATTQYEAGLDPSWLLGLWRRGHDLASTRGIANVQAIRIVRRDGTITELHAGSDPRKHAEPRGR